MKWRFPNIDSCPKVYCNRWFESRYAAKVHYCKEHAKNDLLCTECDTLISMTGQLNMVNHYQRKHPDADIPMPSASAVVDMEVDAAPESTNLVCNDQIAESNEQTTQHNASPSSSPPKRSKPPYKKRGRLYFTRRSNRSAKKNKSISFADVSKENLSFFLHFCQVKISFFGF